MVDKTRAGVGSRRYRGLGSYGFSAGHVRESMRLSPESVPSFQHFPGPARKIARTLVLRDPWLPAPALLKGLASAWALNKTPSLAYLLEKKRMEDGGISFSSL